ncbi:piwi-like protein Ago3 [Athalia rosae]|uniref:piwi-like protein Ago3 n=1 Tax=Athalia rosae TaxID=37344 RepID=UPI002033E19A|nr:piwi-like protein Ago3 [Athalia rosae]XP_048509451.1 piwi-like protein Ago3 [Athalia rosae]
MADKRETPPYGRGGPMGRGESLLAMLKKQNEQSAGPSNVPTQSAASSPPAPPAALTPALNLGRGRASLLGLIKQSSEKVTSSPANVPGQPTQALGRASLLDLLKKTPSSTSHPGPSGDAVEVASSTLSNLKVTESVTISEPISRQGASGNHCIDVQVQANYIRLKVDPGRGVFEYAVKYMPDLDSRPLRFRLLNQHANALGTKIFDGTTLSLSRPLDQPRTELQSEHPLDGTVVKLSIIYKKQRRLGEVPGLYNVLFRRVMHALDLVKIGRQHFSSKAALLIPQHRLELWPGYVTAIDEYEGGLQLCLHSTHRVLRTDTVRDYINDFYKKDGAHFKDNVLKELIGMSVLTRYNNKVYRIDDIAWNDTPLKQFSMKQDPNKKITLVEYYKSHWNIAIKDVAQPLLVHTAKVRLPSGEQIEQTINLIPELCYMSGLTEPMKRDFKIMKDIAQVTRTTPEHRVGVARRFIEEVKKNEVAQNLLASWGLNLEDDVVTIPGRVLNPETILFGKGKVHEGQQNADWNTAVCRLPMLTTPGLKNWCLLFCRRDVKCAEDFHTTISRVGPTMGMDIARAKLIELKDDRTETYLNELKANINPRMEIMVIIFPTSRDDRYAAVKKLCCVEMPIASQVIIAKTINRPDRIKSVTQKIALQINCKLGGTLWALKNPMDNLMVCGIDTHHPGTDRNSHGSVAAFVASLDKPFTRWFSKVCLQRPNQELLDSLKVCLITALKAYFKVNSRFPDRIIIYRDGVGDGQLVTIRDYEVKQLEDSFSLISADYKPRLCVVIVQKQINTRIFGKMRNRLENPLPGTIVDHSITRRTWYDFFLVSQNVRQGTVSPTHYLVIYDTTEIKTDHLQRMTFKLCHLYYNWPGTVRVPAPCQYAHKLAFLVGQSIQREPNQQLADKLYFL